MYSLFAKRSFSLYDTSPGYTHKTDSMFCGDIVRDSLQRENIDIIPPFTILFGGIKKIFKIKFEGI